MLDQIESGMAKKPEIIVMGGGPAGVTAALRASELGASVALVERDRLGGTCTNDGCVPTRVLAKAARLLRDANQYGQYGMNVEMPALDFEKLMSRAQQVVYQIHEKKQLISHLNEAGVQVVLGHGAARFKDNHVIQLEDGLELEAEKFILCAGGHARRLLFPGSDYALTHHEVWELKRLPQSVAILGGAATGCQLASILSTFGAHVLLLEVNPVILGAEDSQVSHYMEKAFEERGIKVISGISGTDSIDQSLDGLVLTYRHNNRVEQIQTEAVILASGWPGNADELNLGAAGVETNRGYVVVDDYLRTSAPHIFAAGDITGRMMLVQSAGVEGRIAAENAVLGGGERFGHQVVAHGSFTDPEYASVGLSEDKLKQNGIEYAVATVSYADLDRAVIDGHTEGFFKLIVSQENHRILGAHVVGEQAVEVIQIVAACMAGEIWVEQVAEMELAYPTFTAIVGLAARKLVYQLGVMPLAPEWHALGRSIAAEWEQRTD